VSTNIVRFTTKAFDALLEYSCSLPTGVFIGKQWKRNLNFRTNKPPKWLLGEYTEHPDPDRAYIEWRDIEVVDPMFP